MIIALVFVPRLRALRSCFCEASSFVLTRNVPKIEARIPRAARTSGKAIALMFPNAVTPRADAEITEPT